MTGETMIEPCGRCGHPRARHFETGPSSDCLGQPYSEGCYCDEYIASDDKKSDAERS